MPNSQTLATLVACSDQCWMEATEAFRELDIDDRNRLLNALESDSLTIVMLLPANLLNALCGFALAAIVETRLRVERQDIDEGNDDDQFDTFRFDFEPD